MLWVLKEPSQWEGSFEHPKHMFKWMGKEINAILGAQTILIWTYANFNDVHVLYSTYSLKNLTHLLSNFSRESWD